MARATTICRHLHALTTMCGPDYSLSPPRVGLGNFAKKYCAVIASAPYSNIIASLARLVIIASHASQLAINWLVMTSGYVKRFAIAASVHVMMQDNS